MYEELTAFLPVLRDAGYGEWIFDRENDGTPEKPMHLPYVDYSREVREFESAVSRFVRQHPGMGVPLRYCPIPDEWKDASGKPIVSKLDGSTVVSMIAEVIRSERFCDGAVLGAFRDGSMTNWLARLEEIDREYPDGEPDPWEEAEKREQHEDH